MSPRRRRALAISAGVAWVALSAFVWWWGIRTVHRQLALANPYSRESVALAIASKCAGEVEGTFPAVRVEPDYPPRALELGVEGWVEVEYRVLRDGSVREARVVAAEPEALGDESSVVQTVSRWVHCPNEALPEEGALRKVHFSFALADD